MSEEFKLNLYFNMYKDGPVGSRDNFRAKFIKKHGKYQYLPELIYMIERYQYEKFGMTIWNEASYNFKKSNKKRRK